MQIPIPSTPDKSRLSVQRIIPSPHTQLHPTLRVNRQLHLPKPPSVIVFLRQVLIGHFIPDAPAIATDLHTNRSVTPAAVCPPPQGDLAIVDDLGFFGRCHDGAGDGHVLDAEAVAV